MPHRSSTTTPSFFYAIKQVELAVRSRMDEVLRPTSITVLQYTALTVLRRRDGLSSAEMARNSFVTAQTMGEMVTALEARGLITRQADPANRRRMVTSLTDAGRALLASLDTAMDDLESTMLDGLSPQQRADFGAYLGHCRISLGSVAAK